MLLWVCEDLDLTYTPRFGPGRPHGRGLLVPAGFRGAPPRAPLHAFGVEYVGLYPCGDCLPLWGPQPHPQTQLSRDPQGEELAHAIERVLAPAEGVLG
jgi:hypothetical protein